MNVSFSNTFCAQQANLKSQVAFKGEFEDIIALSKKNNIPHTMELKTREFFGPARTIHPTTERLKIVEEALKNTETKAVWRGLFKAVSEAWRKII